MANFLKVGNWVNGRSSSGSSEAFRERNRRSPNFFSSRGLFADSSEELSNPEVSTFLKINFNGDSAIDARGLSNSVVSSFLNAAPGGGLATNVSGLSNSVRSSFLKFGCTGEFVSDSSALERPRADGALNGFSGGESSCHKH